MLDHASVMLFVAVVCSAGADAPVLRRDAGVITLRAGDQQLDVSLRCPQVQLSDGAGSFGGELPAGVNEQAESGTAWECTYPPLEVAGVPVERVLRLAWSSDERVLRKWLRLRGAPGAPALQIAEITLEAIHDVQLVREFHLGPPQSYPIFVAGFFLGIEFPVAASRIDSGTAVLGHRPLCRLPADTWYESRRAVYGPAAAGNEVLAFHEYIETHRPAPKGMHFNYNSWWTSPVPFSEADILGLMQIFEQELYTRHGVALDSFTIDLGWSDPRGVWDIDRRLFPEEFAKIQAGAEAMGARLGLWTSPSSCYPQAVDPQAARDAGYENGGQQFLSLAGEKYRDKYASTIADYAARFRLAQVKLDGLYLGGPEFLAGTWPAEATAAGAAEAFDRMRAASPDAWLEATYSAYASPWWLFHVNSVIGCFGDDSPQGRVPCPVYRESYTTARDYFNLQGADHLPAPIPAQEVLGVIHQSDDCFMNDAVTTVLRGHAFIPLYVNPRFMNPQRWEQLAGLIIWARAHSDVLTAPQTRPLRPATWLRDGTPWLSHTAPMPREPYGYAHWDSRESLILLRNPWIKRQSYAVTVDMPGAQRVHAVSLYPEPRLYAEDLPNGQPWDVPLAPYETLVLALAAGPAPADLPRTDHAIGQVLAGAAHDVTTRAQRVRYELPAVALGADYTSLAPQSGQAAEVQLACTLESADPGVDRRLLVLLEGPCVPQGDGQLHVGQQEIALRSIRSDSGFSATTAVAPEHWQFLEAVLPTAGGSVSLHVVAPEAETTVAVWIWADKAGESAARGSGSLPAPQRISLDSTCLLAPLKLSAIDREERRAAPVERIDGVFLDALEPVEARQGWGTLQRNRSVWERDMTIGSRHFRRGLGTHANSELVYALEQNFSRFQAWVGPDMATYGSVGFTVWVDGQQRWASGVMRRGDEPQRVDLDIQGAKQLRLIVDDAGDGISADHANWADARLVR
ncbi:MAG: NPCBM/NEW2 domain-containing protein [Pirellulaceae bacterium]|jgi:hypothetical protein|nr:NPCBM/NEW2 domain-containing protein [Pirellulaceae bacterium]